MEVGERYDVELVNITRDGQGVAYGQDDKIIMIDGVSDDDAKVRIEIVKILEEMVFAKKYARLKEQATAKKPTTASQSPYAMDMDDEDEEYQEENGQEEESEE